MSVAQRNVNQDWNPPETPPPPFEAEAVGFVFSTERQLNFGFVDEDLGERCGILCFEAAEGAFRLRRSTRFQ